VNRTQLNWPHTAHSPTPPTPPPKKSQPLPQFPPDPPNASNTTDCQHTKNKCTPKPPLRLPFPPPPLPLPDSRRWKSGPPPLVTSPRSPFEVSGQTPFPLSARGPFFPCRTCFARSSRISLKKCMSRVRIQLFGGAMLSEPRDRSPLPLHYSTARYLRFPQFLYVFFFHLKLVFQISPLPPRLVGLLPILLARYSSCLPLFHFCPAPPQLSRYFSLPLSFLQKRWLQVAFGFSPPFPPLQGRRLFATVFGLPLRHFP